MSGHLTITSFKGFCIGNFDNHFAQYIMCMLIILINLNSYYLSDKCYYENNSKTSFAGINFVETIYNQYL